MVGFFVYVGDFYKADDAAIAVFEPSGAQGVGVERTDGALVAYPEGETIAGFIFYPGGKVEYDAYEPLMREIASHGVLCVLVEMPFNLAVFDVSAADRYKNRFPEVSSWYVGGHSLGGSMAASYVKGSSGYCGLILLAAYSTEDLSDKSISVLSVYGSEDGVLDGKKYNKYKKNLPSGFEEIVIDGGNHAYFGSYGEQAGDGMATLSREEQTILSALHIVRFITTTR